MASKPKQSQLRAEVEIEVPFHDVDPMEVVWHGHYAKYCEHARTRLLQMLDYDYPQMRASGFLWPVVHYQLKFVRPARYGQRLQAQAWLLEYEYRLKIGYEINDAATGERLTKGYTVQVAVAISTGEMQYASPNILVECVERCR